NRVREVSEPSHGDSAVGRQLLREHLFAAHHATPRNRSASVTGIEYPPDVFVFLRLRAEYGVYLVPEQRRRAGLIGYLSEYIGGGGVYRHEGARREEFCHLERPCLPRPRLRRQERES